MPGIHHVTAITGDPVRNLGFYTHVLGLRLVKKTVNFDDPSAYHFYFGGETGRPGTILTFFPWVNATEGQRGVGETSQTAFRVPLRSSVTGRSASPRRGFLMGRRKSFSVKPSCRSRIRTERRSRSWALPMQRTSRALATRTFPRSTQFAASRA